MWKMTSGWVAAGGVFGAGGVSMVVGTGSVGPDAARGVSGVVGVAVDTTGSSSDGFAPVAQV